MGQFRHADLCDFCVYVYRYGSCTYVCIRYVCIYVCMVMVCVYVCMYVVLCRCIYLSTKAEKNVGCPALLFF